MLEIELIEMDGQFRVKKVHVPPRKVMDFKFDDNVNLKLKKDYEQYIEDNLNERVKEAQMNKNRLKEIEAEIKNLYKRDDVISDLLKGKRDQLSKYAKIKRRNGGSLHKNDQANVNKLTQEKEDLEEELEDNRKKRRKLRDERIDLEPDSSSDNLEDDIKALKKCKSMKCDIRHIIDYDTLVNYWKNYITSMPIDKANEAIKARINELRENIKRYTDYYPAKTKYLEENKFSDDENINEKTRLQENLRRLLFLENTNPENLFFGPARDNRSLGAKKGRSKRHIERSGYSKSGKSNTRRFLDESTSLSTEGLKEEISKYKKVTFDKGEDDPLKKQWGNGEKIKKSKERIEKTRKVAYGIIHGGGNRREFDPDKETKSEELSHYEKMQMYEKYSLKTINQELSNEKLNDVKALIMLAENLYMNGCFKLAEAQVRMIMSQFKEENIGDLVKLAEECGCQRFIEKVNELIPQEDHKKDTNSNIEKDDQKRLEKDIEPQDNNEGNYVDAGSDSEDDDLKETKNTSKEGHKKNTNLKVEKTNKKETEKGKSLSVTKIDQGKPGKIHDDVKIKPKQDDRDFTDDKKKKSNFSIDNNEDKSRKTDYIGYKSKEREELVMSKYKQQLQKVSNKKGNNISNKVDDSKTSLRKIKDKKETSDDENSKKSVHHSSLSKS